MVSVYRKVTSGRHVHSHSAAHYAVCSRKRRRREHRGRAQSHEAEPLARPQGKALCLIRPRTCPTGTTCTIIHTNIAIAHPCQHRRHRSHILTDYYTLSSSASLPMRRCPYWSPLLHYCKVRLLLPIRAISVTSCDGSHR